MDEDLKIPISISARHIHLTKEHVATLFGKDARLTVKAPLSQPGQFACNETVSLTGPRSTIQNVRVLGPERKESQVEISRTDEFALGIDAPVRLSGDTSGTPGIRLIGPAGEVALDHGVIQAKRHIHMTPPDAQRFGVEDGECVMVKVGGERGIVYDDVIVRVSNDFMLDMHVDTDEANAAELRQGAGGILIKGPTMVRPDGVQ
ncbi:MAG: phosphate propanoyltransferase [Candidatus Eremiobacteraeota bacterium]|nr:phosphate propanoyltransferase [Candidatus Eremiobacteraeota bacterium]